MKNFVVSQPGEYHVARGVPNQDAAATAELKLRTQSGDSNAVIGIVADGVGSCERAEVGSATAVDTCMRYLPERLKAAQLPEEAEARRAYFETALRGAFAAALDRVRATAAHASDDSGEYATTLTVAILTEEDRKLYYAHVGDSGVVALFEDGRAGLVTSRMKGAASNEVYPLEAEEMWSFGEADGVIACALCTDGLLDFAVLDEALGSQVYVPFFAPALCSGEDADSTRQAWEEILASEEVRKHIQDDRTLCVLQNESATASLRELIFDEAGYIAAVEAERARRAQAFAQLRKECPQQPPRKKQWLKKLREKKPRPFRRPDACGGQSCVFAIDGNSDELAKVFFSVSEALSEKLRAMLGMGVEPRLADGALAIAWPSKLLTAPGGETLGYVMPAASPNAKPLTGMLRAPVSRDAARRAAHGLCAAVAHAHENGLVIGDLSPNSALVGEGFAVTLIGLEHCGFQKSQGKTWAAGPCPASLAAPELLDGEPCTQASDCYALGKLVGRLMGGRDAPPNVRALSVKALHATPDERPTAKQWLEALACT